MIRSLLQWLRKYVLFLLPVAGLSFAIFFVVQTQSGGQEAPRGPAPLNKPAGTGIAASGIVEAVSQNIPVGAPVPGVVVEVISFDKVRTKLRGQHGKPGDKDYYPGDLLFRLDKRQLEKELEIRKAALASVLAQLKKQELLDEKGVFPLGASTVGLTASPEGGPLFATSALFPGRSELIPERIKRVPNVRPEEIKPFELLVDIKIAYQMEIHYLYKAAEKEDRSGVIAKKAWGEVVRQKYVADLEVEKAKADLELVRAGAWIFDKEISRKAVEQADAQVKQVQTELTRLEVRVPADLDGYELLFINVFPGQFVGAPPGGNLILVGDTRKGLHLRVDIDEHDVPRFKVDEKEKKGPPALAVLRGDPESYEFKLEYVRLDPYIIPKKSLTGDNTERVDTRVLQVIYRIKEAPGAPRVYVGQQMDVFIQGETGLRKPGWKVVELPARNRSGERGG